MKLFLILLTLIISGCGMSENLSNALSNNPKEICYDGVIYLKFSYAITVKYKENGQISKCKGS